MKNLFVRLLLYAHFLHLVISFIRPFGPSGSSPTIYNRTMVSYDPVQNHVAIISKSISQNSQSADMLHFLYISYGNINPYAYSNIILPYKAIDVRSNHNNLFDYNIVNCPPSERRFLLLSQNKFVVMLFNDVSFMKNITTSAAIVDYCMKPRREQFYTLQVNQTTGSQYTIGYYSPFLNCSRTVTIPEWYKPTEKPNMKCHNDVLILNFPDKVRVYSLNQSLWNIKTIKNHGILSYMHTFGNVINVNNDSHILIFDKNVNFSLVKAIPKDPAFNYFFSLYYGNFSYLYITRKHLGSNFTFLAQYDLEIDMIVHEVNTSMAGVHLQTIHQKIFLYEKTNGIVSNAVAYSLDNDCYIINSSCPPNYFLTSANICTNPSLNPNFGGGYSGVSNLFTIKCCLQYFLVEQYNLYNQNNNFDGCCINEERVNTSEQSGLLRISNSSILNQSSYAISKVLTITESGRLLPQVFQYFAMLVDDFELYGYHNYSYPLILVFFIDKASIMNEVAIGEQFTNSIVIADFESKQFFNLLLSYNWICVKKLKSIYFLHVAKELYFQDTIAVAVNYFSVKLLHLLLYLLSKRSTFLIKFYERLRNSSRWWIIICGLLETNMSSTTFFCFLQFMIPSYFCFANKLNLVFVVVELFCLLQYCIIFYQIVFSLQKKEYAKNLISRAKYSSSGFYMQTIIFLCKNFCRGLICGLFINCYSYVIRLYVLTDFVFVLVLIKNYQQFEKKIYRNFTLFYLLCLTTLDAYFLLEKDFIELLQQTEIHRQIFVLCVIFIIVVLAITLIFGDLTNLVFKSAAKCFNALERRSKQSSNKNKNAINDLAQALKNKNAMNRKQKQKGSKVTFKSSSKVIFVKQKSGVTSKQMSSTSAQKNKDLSFIRPMRIS